MVLYTMLHVMVFKDTVVFEGLTVVGRTVHCIILNTVSYAGICESITVMPCFQTCWSTCLYIEFHILKSLCPFNIEASCFAIVVAGLMTVR
jgi:hypothetical protein